MIPCNESNDIEDFQDIEYDLLLGHHEQADKYEYTVEPNDKSKMHGLVRNRGVR